MKARFEGCGGKHIKEFFLECNPPRTTHQSGQVIYKSKTGKPFIAQNPKAKKVTESLLLMLKPHRMGKPFEKPTRLTIDWRFPFRKTDSQKVRSLGQIPCTARPDGDNLAKLLLDALQKCGGFVTDDSIIYDLRIIKSYAARAGINIRLEQIEQTGGGVCMPLIP